MCGRYVSPDEASIEREFSASYRGPWSRGQRCLQVATGFYEGQVQPGGKTKVPFYITASDQPLFAFAALWDSSKTDTGERIESVTHITLRKADREAWLSGTPEEAGETLTPYPDDLMVAWPA